jgi:hypothetical protein
MTLLDQMQSIFGPRPQGAEQKKSGSAEAGRSKGNMMLNILDRVVQSNAQPRIQAQSIKYLGTIDMTPGQWATVIENPRQRDTEKRARNANHLRQLHPSHVKVNAAQTPDGQLYKLDGHTRSFLWSSGEVEAPAKLYVDLWHCPDVESVKEMYGTFDSKSAAETIGDQVFGAVRELKFDFQSELLKSQRFAGAMRYAYEAMHGAAACRAKTTYEMARYFKRELNMLDACMPSSNYFQAAMVAAALITFRRYGEQASQFWTAIASNAGFKNSDGMDAVQALLERMARLRESRQTSGRGNNLHIIAVCLSAFESHRSGYRYSLTRGGIKAIGDVAFREWMASAKSARREG